jgi:hypothetical protein
MGTHNQSSNCGSCSELFSLWKKGTLPTELAPHLQRFVRGSADLHIFTVRTKISDLSVNNFAGTKKQRTMNQNGGLCGCVCVCVGGWVRDFRLPTFDFRLLISNPFLSMGTTTREKNLKIKKITKKCILYTFSPQFVVISLFSLNSEPSFFGEVSFLCWKII